MLSIIIPTLNEKDYLPLLLESIKKQDYKDYEIIVADAGSRDDTLKIAERYNCTIVEGGSVSKGRNNGAKVAKGDLLLYLDADVILSDNFLSGSVNEFKKRNLGIAGFKLIPINAKKIDVFFYGIWAGLNQKLFYHAASAIMVRKEVHNTIGGFDEEIKFIEDYSYTREAAKISNYGFIKLPVFTSLRRFEKDGRLATYTKYILGGMYIIFLGPIKSNIFNYKFGHYKNNKNRN